MKLTTTDVKNLINTLNGIKEITEEATFTATKEGLKFEECDESMVSLVNGILKASGFEEYNYDNKEFTINLEQLIKILKCTTKEDKIKFETDFENNKLKITMLSDIKQTFVIPLLNIEKSNTLPPIKELNFKSIVETKIKTIQKAIKNADILNDWLIFEIRDKSLILSNEDSVSKLEVLINSEELIYNNKEEAKSRYTLEYLKKIFKTKTFCELVKISFGTDYPAKFEFVGDHIILNYILAPRIEE
ncbi:MAG: hypothetical protein ACE5KE_00560 [Methanosarcinales archaeon]